MKNKLKTCLAAALTAVLLSGCGSSFIPPQTYGTIKPADDLYIENHYEGTAPTDESVLETVSSSDGLCVIRKKKSYYDVTLDLEHGTHRNVGKAYAEAIGKAYPDYAKIMEPYLYENITNAFSELHEDYSGVQKRINTLTAALDSDHRDELEGFAEEISGGETGFRADNRISYDEAMLISLVPDALRPTNCSAVSLNGSRTASGKRLNARILEWDLGSGRELCTAQCVVRFQNGAHSFTSVSILGMLSVLTAVNRDGLMAGEFDVGSSSRDAYVCDGRTSYSFDLRHCLEQFSSAREAGEYLVRQSSRYTFCVNVMLTDPEEALCAELICTDEKDGHSLLRDGKTKLNDGVEWDDPETMCIVNSYAADGNFDGITGNTNNIIRWEKYRRLFCGCENMTVGRFKECMTCEKQGTDQTVTNFRSSGVVHMVIADYADCTLQAVFAGMDETVDTPEFIALGSWKEGAQFHMTDILMIEDDAELGGLVRDFLIKEGFSARLCSAAETALALLSEEPFGLVLLDVMLPGMNGFETCAAIRKTQNLPIIMMSAITDEESKLTGYENGADDYIDKPFSIKVLTAKIRAQLRRKTEPQQEEILRSCGIVLNTASHSVTKNGRPLALNAKEFELLRYLMLHAGKALTRDALFDAVWGIDCFSEPSTVSVHIRWLREKLEEDPKTPKLIRTVHKRGYIFGEEP